MDLFRSWIYGRERPERFSTNPNKEKSSSTSQNASSENINENIQYTGYSQNARDTYQEPSKLEKLILKVVPLQPGDCLGCKLVGTSVMIGSGIIVLTSAIAGRKRNPSLTGQKLTAYYVLCGSLFVGFQTAAICRFFDLGPFGYLARLQAKGNR